MRRGAFCNGHVVSQPACDCFHEVPSAVVVSGGTGGECVYECVGDSSEVVQTSEHFAAVEGANLLTVKMDDLDLEKNQGIFSDPTSSCPDDVMHDMQHVVVVAPYRAAIASAPTFFWFSMAGKFAVYELRISYSESVSGNTIACQELIGDGDLSTDSLGAGSSGSSSSSSSSSSADQRVGLSALGQYRFRDIRGMVATRTGRVVFIADASRVVRVQWCDTEGLFSLISMVPSGDKQVSALAYVQVGGVHDIDDEESECGLAGGGGDDLLYFYVASEWSIYSIPARPPRNAAGEIQSGAITVKLVAGNGQRGTGDGALLGEAKFWSVTKMVGLPVRTRHMPYDVVVVDAGRVRLVGASVGVRTVAAGDLYPASFFDELIETSGLAGSSKNEHAPRMPKYVVEPGLQSRDELSVIDISIPLHAPHVLLYLFGKRTPPSTDVNSGSRNSEKDVMWGELFAYDTVQGYAMPFIAYARVEEQFSGGGVGAASQYGQRVQSAVPVHLTSFSVVSASSSSSSTTSTVSSAATSTSTAKDRVVVITQRRDIEVEGDSSVVWQNSGPVVGWGGVLSCGSFTKVWGGEGDCISLPCVTSRSCLENEEIASSSVECVCKPGFFRDRNLAQSMGLLGDSVYIGSSSSSSGGSSSSTSKKNYPCGECPSNSVCAGGSEGEESAVSCNSLVVGSYSPAGASATSLCLCPAGTYLSITLENQKVCSVCQPGFWCPGGISPVNYGKCPVHRTSVSGSSSLSNCVCATGYLLDNNGVCVDCSSVTSICKLDPSSIVGENSGNSKGLFTQKVPLTIVYAVGNSTVTSERKGGWRYGYTTAEKTFASKIQREVWVRTGQDEQYLNSVNSLRTALLLVTSDTKTLLVGDVIGGEIVSSSLHATTSLPPQA
eukprot:3933321-Rhodomonas_salina.1